MKKILYLLEIHIDSIGGSQESTRTIVNQMLDCGYDVGIFMTEGKSEESQAICSLTDKCYLYLAKNSNSMSKGRYIMYMLKELRKCIKEFKPDIIHAQNPIVAIIFGILLRFNLIDKKIKCYYTDRGFFVEYSKYRQQLFKFVAPKYDKLIATTEINLTDWKKSVKLKDGICISNVLDDEWFEYDELYEKELKRKYKVDGKFNIGFSGRYVEYKRWDTVMEICKVFSKHENIKITIAMASKNDDTKVKSNEYLTQMKEILGDKLILFENANQKQMKEFYYILDAFVLTSDGESFGRTLIEAMTKNNLAFGTNSGGVPNVVNNKGFLFEVGNVEQICDMLKEYMNNPVITKEEKRKFMEYAKNTYTVKKLKEEHIKLYSDN